MVLPSHCGGHHAFPTVPECPSNSSSWTTFYVTKVQTPNHSEHMLDWPEFNGCRRAVCLSHVKQEGFCAISVSAVENLENKLLWRLKQKIISGRSFLENQLLWRLNEKINFRRSFSESHFDKINCSGGYQRKSILENQFT